MISGVNVAVTTKMAERVEAALATAINKSPRCIDPRKLLPAVANREQAPPNVSHIHYGILKSFYDKGFDSTRPHVGVCIKIESAEGKAKLLDHNYRLSQGNPMMPPIFEDLVQYGTIACSHLNLSLRCIQAGSHSPSGDLASLVKPGSSLAYAVKDGHSWIILPESTLYETQVEISIWRNADQDENLAVSELEILRYILQAATDLANFSHKITLGDMSARAARKAPWKIKDRPLLCIGKYLRGFHVYTREDLAKDLGDFHAQKINAKKLTVAPALFESIVGETEFAKRPLVMHYIVITQYSDERTLEASGGPDTANLIELRDLVNFAKRPDCVKSLGISSKRMWKYFRSFSRRNLGIRKRISF